MAGEYLTAAEEAAYGRYSLEGPLLPELERFFFFDDFDRELVAKRRGDYSRLVLPTKATERPAESVAFTLL